jgi:hypothetical protein
MHRHLLVERRVDVRELVAVPQDLPRRVEPPPGVHHPGRDLHHAVVAHEAEEHPG